MGRDIDAAEKGAKSVQGHEEFKKPVGACLWQAMIVSGCLIYGSYSVLIHLCEVDGKLPFSSASCVLVTEIMKLVISVTLYVSEKGEEPFQMPTLQSAIPFAIPAILYCINNNLGIHIQLQMDPATYQVLSNLKILSTAILYRLIIKRPISGIQWFSLCMLVGAGVCNSYGGLMAKPGENSAGIIHISMVGLIMIGCYCTISGLSGVYTEYILKGKYEMSIHIQNSLLYIFGIVLNGGVWLGGTLNGDESWNLFKGYSIYTWLVVFSQAAVGLIMSAIMKHASNITRLFLISCAMLVTTVLSILIFNLQLNAYFCAAFVLVLLALYLYHQS